MRQMVFGSSNQTETGVFDSFPEVAPNI